MTRRSAAARPLAAEARLIRADLLCGWGARLKDEALLRAAIDDAAAAADRLDLAYEPLTWARAEILRGQALALWGEAAGDVDAVAAGATTLAGALDHLTRDHSPLDWARTQIALAHALQSLGEASADERAYEQAVTCYDRANLVLKDAPATPLRGLAAGERAMCLARSAELTGDLAVLDTRRGGAEDRTRRPAAPARPGGLGARPAAPGPPLRGPRRHHRQGPWRARRGRHGPGRRPRRLRRAGPALAEHHGHRGAGAPARRTRRPSAPRGLASSQTRDRLCKLAAEMGESLSCL